MLAVGLGQDNELTHSEIQDLWQPFQCFAANDCFHIVDVEVIWVNMPDDVDEVLEQISTSGIRIKQP